MLSKEKNAFIRARSVFLSAVASEVIARMMDLHMARSLLAMRPRVRWTGGRQVDQKSVCRVGFPLMII